ncbi:hypothetical protein os1_07120 [Comamonadaceae bacterium OS-1]|nr:hypothetical protein os1_07120 [Comamonadaceae bacterium OS-1]
MPPHTRHLTLQPDLFCPAQANPVHLVDEGLDVTYWAQYFPHDLASAFFKTLLDETAWQQPALRMYGRSVQTPRLTAWYGDAHASYTYSGLLNRPSPWTPTLARLRDLAGAATGARYNAVLLNLYRDGADHVSWHSDDEATLGHAPTIASISLGAERRFCLRPKAPGAPSQQYDIALSHGSLLCMRGQTQSLWEHAVRKELRVKEPRINLTFRKIDGV